MEKMVMYIVAVILAVASLFLGFKLLSNSSQNSKGFETKVLFNLEDFCRVYTSSNSEKYKISFIKETGINSLPVDQYKQFQSCIQGIQELIKNNKEYINPGSTVDKACYNTCKKFLNKLETCKYDSNYDNPAECILVWLGS